MFWKTAWAVLKSLIWPGWSKCKSKEFSSFFVVLSVQNWKLYEGLEIRLQILQGITMPLPGRQGLLQESGVLWCIPHGIQLMFSLSLICTLCIFWRNWGASTWKTSVNVPFETTYPNPLLRLAKMLILLRPNSLNISWWILVLMLILNTRTAFAVRLLLLSICASFARMSMRLSRIFAISFLMLAKTTVLFPDSLTFLCF